LKTYKQFIIVGLVGIGFWQCANQVMPTGGPKDTKPPEIVEAVPPNGSAGFIGNKFSIRFNEFVELDKINKQLLISPPMNTLPDFKLKGKTLIVKFKEELKPNTTYSVYFGDAIVDITEGNPLHNFTYIFSTGNTIDSLSLSGKLVNAFDMKPVEDAYVMLYKNNNDTLPLDSLPLMVKPYYLSKTSKNGTFHFAALSNNKYLIFGLKDQNNSLTFDQPAEQIAFLDTSVKPQFQEKVKIDSLSFDTISGLSPDSLHQILDSLNRTADSLSNAKMIRYQLRMFVNEDTVQRLLKAELLRKNTLRFSFSLSADKVRITPLNYLNTSHWYRSESNPAADTITWFLHHPTVDTLDLIFVQNGDTLGQRELRIIPKKKQRNRRQKKAHSPLKDFIGWHANIKGVIKPNQQLMLIFNQPIARFFTDSVLLITGKDSLYKPDYAFADMLHRKIIFPFKIKEGTAYHLFIPDSTVIDWNGLHNKKIDLSFRSKEAKEYGKLTLQINFKHQQHYILQLLNVNSDVISQVFLKKDTSVVFSFIDPSKYRLKIIYDDNDNKKWDTGNYLRKLQPERVIFFSKELDIKANWEYEESWNF